MEVFEKIVSGFKPLTIFATPSEMFGRVLITLLISALQFKYNIKFSKGRSERCKTKQKRNEFYERNAGTWGKIISFIYS